MIAPDLLPKAADRRLAEIATLHESFICFLGKLLFNGHSACEAEECPSGPEFW